MSLGARLILLGQQLRSKGPKQCPRCGLSYSEDQDNCPHCVGLSEQQVEELVKQSKQVQYGNVLYLVMLFAALIIGFALFFWVF